MILELINTREMQRLRRIRQLGLSYVTYPGAEHSRFVHSLGVTHLVKRIIAQLKFSRDEQEREWLDSILANYELVLCAALLHDIGHGPFSHAIEKTTGIKHEDWTTLIINNENTEVHQVLESFRPGFASEVANVISRIHPCRAVVKLLSSQLDADRIDYLLRDSLMTGAGYGKFDLEWLLNVITIGAIGDEPEVGLKLDKGLNIAEDFVMARYYMYRNVYFHKATRSAELITNAIFSRVKVLIKQEDMDCPPELAILLSDNTTCSDEYLDAYLKLDDHTIWYWFSIWAKSEEEPLLADLCGRILNRHLLKGLEITTTDLTDLIDKIHSLKQEAIAILGQGYDSLVMLDNPSTNRYKDNLLFSAAKDSDEEASEIIFLFDRNKKPQDLASVSEIINVIRNRSLRLQRLYFPEEIRDIAVKVFQQ